MQKEAGLVEERKKRKNHKGSKLSQLLAVPRYADLLEDGEADLNMGENGQEISRPTSVLVKSRTGWQKEMAKWVHNEQESSEPDDIDDELPTATYGRQRSKWLPRSLELLFGGRKETEDAQMRRIRRQQAYTEEAQLMELLADEEADEDRIPDDGKLEGSGDDFDG